VSLMTSAGYREKRRRLLDLLDAQDLDCSSAAPSGQFVVVFRWRPLPHCGHSRGCNGEQKSQLPDRLLRRVRHAVTPRTGRRLALRQNDLSRFGKLLTESHASLRDDSQVSVPELDTLVGIAQQTPGVPGARLTGAGFGGCAVAVVTADAAEGASTEITGPYRREVAVRDVRSSPPRRWTEGPVAVRRRTRADSDT
jgi:galactokinase